MAEKLWYVEVSQPTTQQFSGYVVAETQTEAEHKAMENIGDLEEGDMGEPDEPELESIRLCPPADFSAPDSDEYTDAELAVVEATEAEFKIKYQAEHREEIDAAIQARLSSLRKEAEAATKGSDTAGSGSGSDSPSPELLETMREAGLDWNPSGKK